MAIRKATEPENGTEQTGRLVDSPEPTRIAEVPDMSYYDRYIPRRITPDLSEFDIFDSAFEHNENVLLEGPTGPGKTSAILAWAALRNHPFYAVPCNQSIDPSQLFGKWIPDGSGGYMWQDGPFTDLVRHGGALLLNEVNFMPERIAAVTYALLDVRRQIVLMDHKAEIIHASNSLIVFADMNPEYEGTRPLNKAFRNRFAHQIDWQYDLSVEKQLVKSKVLIDMGHKIRDSVRGGDIDTPVSTNMLQEFERFSLRLGVSYAIQSFVSHFNSDERAVVQVVVDTNKKDLEREYKTLGEELAAAGEITAPRTIRRRRPANTDPNSALGFVTAERG